MAWAEEEFEAVTKRVWRDREFDKLGYLRIKGARELDAEGLAVLRELYLMRDERARELDRPPFKVLGNRTLLEVAQRRPETQEDLARIKGVTELILRRMGREVLAAVKRGTRRPHGPIPRTNGGGGRRRLDRYTEERLSRLKRWRSTRAAELELDPGVLCPNSALEVVAWQNPGSAEELVGITELKGWFVRELGAELVEALGSPETRAQK
jgi:ribonuclease D